MSLLEVSGLRKIYTARFGGNQVEALHNVNFSVERGEYLAIMGESGSGKTTLLNILAALDKPTAGVVKLEGRELSKIKDAELAAFRRDHLGFVFQEFNLLDTFTVEDNIYLPLVLAGRSYRVMHELLTPLAERLGITEILKKYPYEISGGQKQRVAVARALITKPVLPLAKGLGIEELLHKYPYEVSGGQKQRAAVARALITEPELILADEPTGALDSKATDELLRLFASVNRQGQTVLMVTHSVRAASTAGRVLFIKDGEVFHQLYRGEATDEQFYQRISDTLTMLTTGGMRQ